MQKSSSKLKPKTPKRPTAKNTVEEAEPELVISHGSSLYHLGTEIGRGGFAVVYQAFNGHTGQTVAVKRFPLSAIAGKESQLSVELAEIELMHELDHPNIVKYFDTVKSKNFLYIVLEYMENGSLVNLIKKFGCFSESLTAIYVSQVLRGLKYLHDQGVLHRDIKGANILTSKDGMVKLADFGVAMKMTEGSEANPSTGGMEDTPDLAGSPYWMAPEIVEMSTPTSACDIWSVGCVVIELLTSKPPYYDLDPMSALFRIVSDDYPPFPEGISQACKDFLLQCFHKEPTMRSSADKLLAHPWLSNSSSKQSLVQTSQMLKSRSIDAADSSVGKSTEVIQSAVRMYELNLQTIPEAEHELDSDRSRSGRRAPDSLSVSAVVSARSSARGSARSETLEGAGIAAAAQEAQPLAAIAEADWRSVPLSGSTSLPGSISRSRSHSDDAAPATTLDAGFAVSGDSARSSQSSSVLALSHSQKTLTPPTGKRGASQEPFLELDGGVKGSPLFIATGTDAPAGREYTSSDDVFSEEANSGKLSSFGEMGPSASGHDSVTTASASASFLQGMKIVSDDSFDEPNWDIDMSVSRDSVDDSAPKPSLLRNALGVPRMSPSRSKTSAGGAKVPFVFNLNSQSMSFTNGSASAPVSATEDWDVEELTEKKPAAPVSKAAPPLSGNKLNINIPKIQIPKLALVQKPSLSMHTQHNQHSQHSSIDLMKYQEDPEDDDFGDFDAPESVSPKKTSPMRTFPASKPAVIAGARGGGFVSGSSSSSQQTSPVPQKQQMLSAMSMEDDLDSDFAFEGEQFDDKIKAYKIGGRVGALRDANENALTTRSTNSNLEASSTDESASLHSPSVGGHLANQLRKRIQQQVTTKDAHDEDLDAFINYQYDEKDFKQNEAKDLHFRRSREIVEIMNCIRQEIKVKEIIDLCNQLLTIFSEVPEQRDHLITHHGVMPIVDMFDARVSSSNFRMGSQGAKSTKALNVMRVVNKIIEGSVKAKEQLSLVGIIPTVMNLFDNSFRQSVYHHNAPQPAYSVGPFAASNISSSTSSDGTADIQAMTPGITIGDPKPPLAPHFALREDVDPVTLEAARFIHQICSTSSLTLQMLIGAGGLSVLTGMVSLGATLNPSLLGPNSMNVAAAASAAGTPAMGSASSHSVTTPRINPSFSSSSQRNISSGSVSPMTDMRSLVPGIASISTFSVDINDAAPVPVTDQMLAEDNFFNPKAAANLGVENEDLLNRMQIFQMGIDCVSEVFSMKSSRSRDFCRLFVKLGLLHPLSLSFQNILAMYRARQLTASGAQGIVGTTSSDAVTPSSTAATPRDGLRASSHPHRRETSGPTITSPRHRRESSGGSSGGASLYIHSHHQEAEESAECKYALRMASLFFTFSRSDAIVAETMVKAEHCVLQVILTALQAPELRSSAGGRTTPLTLAVSAKLEAAANPAANSHTSALSTSPSLFKKVHLLPTYVEIIDLLLKCLKNLSMEPSALGDLETAGTLETLVPLLSGPLSDRCRTHIFPCIFNMCRINKRRQDRVAALGIVPHLKKVILDGSPLRQFALPILFDLAHTSAATRAELGKWSCQPFFLDLLKENYWQAFALNSLAVWLSSDPVSVAGLLVEPAHLTKLIEFFKAAQSQTIHTLHRPLLDMMLKSPELCRALGLSALFTSVLIKRLRGTDEAIVLRSLLKMLQLLHEFHQNSQEWVQANSLVSLVEEFARSERKVLVRQLAKKLLLDFTESAALTGRNDVA